MLVNLFDHKKNIFSQNGEDGIIEKIFKELGIQDGTACEFGAWDGIYLSNIRNLILKGWKAIFIESDPKRFSRLVDNYINNSDVYCINARVDCGSASLLSLAKRNNIDNLMSNLDFLSIDIDGLDLDIFRSLNIRPRVICVEIGCGHPPERLMAIDSGFAMQNLGQPLGVFVNLAKKMGYSLVAHTGNAIFVRDELAVGKFVVLDTIEAYLQHINSLSSVSREWLYLLNLGFYPPFYKFHNPYLRRGFLKISVWRAASLIFRGGGKLVIKRLLKQW